MREAAELAQTDPKAGIAAYDKIAADGAVGPVLQDLAALRAGALLIDANAYDEARRRLEPLTATDRTFRHTAREFLVLASSRAGDSAATKRWFDLMMTDVQTPAATRIAGRETDGAGGQQSEAIPEGAHHEPLCARRFDRIGAVGGHLARELWNLDPSSFDPTAIFDMEIFNTKKKLPGERKPVFPEGTPGVTQGVPQELVKGYQEPGAEAKEAQAAAPKPPPAEAKPKPKPKVVAKPKEESTPTAVTVRPSQPPPQAQAQSQPQSQT